MCFQNNVNGDTVGDQKYKDKGKEKATERKDRGGCFLWHESIYSNSAHARKGQKFTLQCHLTACWMLRFLVFEQDLQNLVYYPVTVWHVVGVFFFWITTVSLSFSSSSAGIFLWETRKVDGLRHEIHEFVFWAIHGFQSNTGSKIQQTQRCVGKTMDTLEALQLTDRPSACAPL